MKIFATICLICIVFRYIYVIYTEYISFNDGSSGESAKINFNQWRDLYFVNPSRYNLDEIVKGRNSHLIFLRRLVSESLLHGYLHNFLFDFGIL